MNTNAVGEGIATARFRVDVPDDVNATGLPYELVAKLRLVKPSGVQHLSDTVRLYDVTSGFGAQGSSTVNWLTFADTADCASLGDDCHCVLGVHADGPDNFPDWLCMTRHGAADVDELPTLIYTNLRSLNGDLCIVPNGEAGLALGYLDGEGYDYAGRFLGGFLNRAGSPTQADFDGRTVLENLPTTWTAHECWDRADAANLNPNAAGCFRDLPTAGSRYWPVNPPLSPANHHGSCEPGAGTDRLGFNDDCAMWYAEVEVGEPTPCVVSVDQGMSMECRFHPSPVSGRNYWSWYTGYESSHPMGWSLDSSGPVVDAGSYSSHRDGAVNSARTTGGAGTCSSPGWGSTN